MTTVRTRIAPSPTGDPHVGTAYIALFNLCFAKQHGGTFILRIEDTDQVRSTRESEKQILDALNWLGLQWDEGPDVGGPHAPYRQSERSEIYKQHAAELVQKGHAFHCFCSADRLDEVRKQQMAEGKNPGYDGHCLNLPAQEVEGRLKAGEHSVIRMKVPSEGICEIDDMLRGRIEIPWEQVDMQVLMKADGLPTYHLANVVDDHLMEITHVIRGEEWINSAPKHKLLYQYFGWQMPVLCHMPLLRNPDKSKLSKRKNPTSITYYERMGFLPSALVNYLGRMGWSMPDEREKFTLEEMIGSFDIKRVSLGGPIFDVEKLTWLNGQWLRDLDDEAFIRKVLEWGLNREYLMPAISHIKSRAHVLSDIVNIGGFFLSGMPTITPESFAHKSLDSEKVRKLLQFALWQYDGLRHWDREHVVAVLDRLCEAFSLKLRDVVFPFFVAITGQGSGVSVMDAMVILGPDMTRSRLRHALEVLGGVSKKETKEWEKEAAAIFSAT